MADCNLICIWPFRFRTVRNRYTSINACEFHNTIQYLSYNNVSIAGGGIHRHIAWGLQTALVMRFYQFFLLVLMMFAGNAFTQSTTSQLDSWKFQQGDDISASQPDFDDSNWESVRVPHDWAIYGPFDKEIDKQVVSITQNNEEEATEKTGRTGALPFIGVGWYRTVLSIPELDASKRSPPGL